MGSNGLCVADKSTEELLAYFQNGGAETAFEEIVRRYAGMVYNVCLQVTRDAHDAEDATQAAFLTLALRAKTAGNIRYLGPWLQKVARRLSLDIMRAKKRRKKREERRGVIVQMMQPDRDPRNGLAQAELSDIVRDELGKLPAKYRLPLILHYFGGLRPEEVARELGYKPSTLGVRLHRGRKMLADSLADRGITFSNGMLAIILAGIVQTNISDTVIASTSMAAAGITMNGELPAAIISSRVIALTRHAASAIMWAKAKAVITAVILSSATLAGGAQAIRHVSPIKFDLQMLDPVRFIRPLLRSLFSPPQFSAIDIGFAEVTVSKLTSDQSLSLEPVAEGTPSEAPPAVSENAPQGAIFDSAIAMNLDAAPIASGVSTGSASMSLAQAAFDSVTVSAPAWEIATTILPAASLPSLPASGLTFDTSSRTVLHAAGLHRLDRLVLDSRSAPFETYLMSGSAQLAVNELVIGEFARGSFRQTDGSVQIAGNLILGQQRGGIGSYHLGPTATMSAQAAYIGLAGTGQFTQSGGDSRIGSLHLGHNPGSRGAYSLFGGRLQTASTNIGFSGKGIFEQTGGQHIVGDHVSPSVITLGTQQDGEGVYLMRGGLLQADTLVVGQSGTGVFVQDGGLTSVKDILVAVDPSSAGTAIFNAGSVQLHSSGSVVVGGAGTGTVIVGDGRTSANIVEEPLHSGTRIVVRADQTGKGLLRGHGRVLVTGGIEQNGRVMADGMGKSRALDFSTASHVTNTIDNPIDGTNGWFARHGGKLVLPPIYIDSERTSTWGENPLDPIPDLVNSVRFTVRDVASPGNAIISLLAADYVHVPALPEDEQFVGIWSFDRRDLEFGNANVMIRYDEGAILRLGGDEANLRMWKYDQGWALIPMEQTILDQTLNLFAGHVGGDFRLFGISLHESTLTVPVTIPEPGALSMMMTLACGVLLRRRRLD